ncbi:Oidioi.mRNA.OKI2018_I69.chr2.g7125.t2.cds [Oikopleura dioica]|uniref:Oidioi.mRNA.OKI2018_I69.chr2.g7125.t2.cds n=1 Tax=Oikopleura dioica TaxID=34765 RepID=A0ABN7T560_OIKDI|nr:Oidioi.mRNA.OKI2018_I69.chr2.g7125.t2.cds [Oikopleura dioica]
MSDEYSDDSLDEYGRNDFYRYTNAPGTESPNQSPIPPDNESPRHLPRQSYLDNINFEELNTLERPMPMKASENSPRPSGAPREQQEPFVETYFRNYENAAFNTKESDVTREEPPRKSILKQDSYYTEHELGASQNEEYYAEKQKQYEREYAILLEKEKFQAASMETHKTVRKNNKSLPPKPEIEKPKSSPPKRPKAQNSPIKRSKSLNKPRSYAEQFSNSPKKEERHSFTHSHTQAVDPFSIFKPVRKTRLGYPKPSPKHHEEEYIPQFHQTMNTSREDLGKLHRPSHHSMKKLVESFSRTSFDDSFGPDYNSQENSFNYFQESNNSYSGHPSIPEGQDSYRPPEKHISQAALRTINRPTMQTQDPPKSKSLDSYLEIQNAANKSPVYKKYSVKDYKNLQQQQGIYRSRGLGPEKAPTQDTLRYERRKNFAEAVRYMNKGKIKPQVEEKIDIKRLELERKREIRKKQLEYAKSIPPPPKPSKNRPKKAEYALPGSNGGRQPPPTSTTDMHGASNAEDSTLDALLSRHKNEQARVTRLRALVNIN